MNSSREVVIVFNICIISNDNAELNIFENQIGGYLHFNGIAYEIDCVSPKARISPSVWKDCDYDLAVMDISDAETRDAMLAYSIEIRRQTPKLKVIFVSEDANDALNIFDFNPDYFIVKSQLENRLANAVKYLFSFEGSKEDKLVVSSGSVKYVIPEHMILYFEHYQHNTKIVCKDKEINCSEKLGDILQRLNRNSFIRCHCSFIVNLDEVAELRSSQLVICNGDKIPCSRANQKAVKNAFEVLQERRKNS